MSSVYGGMCKEDTDRNEKLNKLVENSEKFANIVLTLVSKLA
ncbi:hypothetical protein V1387_16700 [Allomuricauda taeanensis]|nr:hypothetical protein [Allomuricauda taeanensis]MEE1964332.1 hypothetical protein [Allomuricauda taeanensis]